MARARRIKVSMAPKPPSLKERLKWSAESVARDVVEQSPEVKRLRDEITEAVQKAALKAGRSLKGLNG